MSTIDLNHIILGCKDNQQTAQHKLYRLYYGLFLKICYRYAKDEDTAMNMLHDGFMKIFKNVQQFQGTGSFEGWMKRTLVHACIDYVRKEAKHAHWVDIDEVPDSTFSASTTVLGNKSVFEDLHVKELLCYIQLLPEVTRIVFNLYVFEGYSHREIGKILNIKEGTSHWHLSKARVMLQAQIARDAKTVWKEYEQ